MSTLLEMNKKRLTMYYEAEQAILLNQSYTVDGMTLNRANLSHVQKMILNTPAFIAISPSNNFY